MRFDQVPLAPPHVPGFVDELASGGDVKRHPVFETLRAHASPLPDSVLEVKLIRLLEVRLRFYATLWQREKRDPAQIEEQAERLEQELGLRGRLATLYRPLVERYRPEGEAQAHLAVIERLSSRHQPRNARQTNRPRGRQTRVARKQAELAA
jgi:hypothetical protein